jgi:hypothetical protein
MRRCLALAFLSLVLGVAAAAGVSVPPAAADPPASDQPCGEDYPPSHPAGEPFTCTRVGRTTFSYTLQGDCVGEPILIEAEAVFVTHVTATDQGWVYVQNYTVNGTGTGVLTGTRYTFGTKGTGASTGHGATESTGTFMTRLIGPGPDDNAFFVLNSHWTVNRENTSEHYNFDAECR